MTYWPSTAAEIQWLQQHLRIPKRIKAMEPENFRYKKDDRVY